MEINELPNEYCKIQEKKEDMNCLICRKNVDLFKNKITFKQCKWHTSCFKCTICNKSLENNFYDINKLDDNNYGGFCEKCYKEKYNEKCCECGTIIDGKYYDIKGNKVHEKCYQNYLIKISDKCNYCNQAILNIPNKFSGHYYNISNKKIHKECYNDYINSIAEKCIICQDNIIGSYYNTKKGKLHKKCYNAYLEKNAPECIICKKKIIKHRYYRLNKTKAIHIDCYNRYYK